MVKLLLFTLLLSFNASADTSTSNDTLNPQPVLETAQEKLNVKSCSDCEPPDVKMTGTTISITPTTYYLISEKQFQCKSKSCKINYRTNLKTHNYPVCCNFLNKLKIEGSAQLANGLTVSPSKGKVLFATKPNNCRFGEGRFGCMLPFFTVAADPRFHKPGEIIFFPAAVGVSLPDGSKHDGLFMVRDIGGAINGADRFDLFSPFESDSSNTFKAGGIVHKTKYTGTKLTGEAYHHAKAKLQARADQLDIDFAVKYDDPKTLAKIIQKKNASTKKKK